MLQAVYTQYKKYSINLGIIHVQSYEDENVIKRIVVKNCTEMGRLFMTQYRG